MCLHLASPFFLVLADFQILPLNRPSWVLRGLPCRFSTPWMVVIHFWLVNATYQMQSPPSILAPARRLSDVFAIRCHKQKPSPRLHWTIQHLQLTGASSSSGSPSAKAVAISWIYVPHLSCSFAGDLADLCKPIVAVEIGTESACQLGLARTLK